MIDLHCHILPLDDGAQSFDESVAIARIARQNRITRIVATPHFKKLSSPQSFLRRRDAALERVRQSLLRDGIDIELFPGAEVQLSDEIFYAGDLRPACIAGSRFLLVEFDYDLTSAAVVRRYLEEILRRGMYPIIAHPERCAAFLNDYELVNDLAEEGTLFQLTAEALTMQTPPVSLDLAAQMAYSNIAQFIATDAHRAYGHRAPVAETFLRDTIPEITDAQLYFMTETAPEAIINDRFPPARAYGYLRY
ncbi:MAG: hypothetical protein LBB67_05310 [Oscillospiraceae bacterium]|jgi:protein-tyrosine phosphatase|nr:hypothetical protein [Oscillospiraceae bacterium]